MAYLTIFSEGLNAYAFIRFRCRILELHAHINIYIISMLLIFFSFLLGVILFVNLLVSAQAFVT